MYIFKQWYLVITGLLIITGLQSCVEPELNAPEMKTLITSDTIFNDDWQFVKGDTNGALSDVLKFDTWEAVSLPHTPKIEPKIVNDQWQGYAWYKKSFDFDPSWKAKHVFLKFEGAMNEATVWLNGKQVGFHRGGYLPFTVELSEHLKQTDNQLVVGLVNVDNDITGPKPLKTLDFNMYGGIYRDVILRVENSVYISDPVNAGIEAGGGIFVTYPNITQEKADISIKTHVVNRGENTDIVVKQFLSKSGKTILSQESAPVSVEAGKSKHIEIALEVKNPLLWSPKSPSLYRLNTQVFSNGELVDEESTNIGIRKIVVEPGSLTINGERIFLRGVNRHQEYPYVGYAISKQADYRDAVRIKSAGFDYVRLSHYPHSPAFIKAADELGLVLLDAILGWQYITKDEAFQEHAWQTCRDMIRRDRNHPSIFAWECSLNESWMEGMEPFVERMNEIVHAEYPGEHVYSAGWVDYGYDIYLQARQHRIQHYEEPSKPYIVSEYGDWEYYAMNAGLNQDEWGELLQAERSSRQLLVDGEKRLLQQATNIQEAHNDNFNVPSVGDGYWVMFDYNRGYAEDLEASGIMSIDRLPKFSYYFYQSQRDPEWTSKKFESGPMVYIANYWKESSDQAVRIFSNTEEVELVVNGKSIGKQKPTINKNSNNLAFPPFLFNVPEYQPGTLKAKAYIDGKQVAEHQVTTPGEIESLALSSDYRLGDVSPSVGDTIFIYASLKDKNGNLIPQSGAQVKFETINGLSFLGPDTHFTEAGIASALVKIESLENPPVVSAIVKGLPRSQLELK